MSKLKVLLCLFLLLPVSVSASNKENRDPQLEEGGSSSLRKSWLPENYVVLDTETTGLGEDATILELNMVKIKNGKVVDTLYFNSKIDPKNNFENNYDKIKDFLNDTIVIGHNIHFDVRMLEQELYRMLIKSEAYSLDDGLTFRVKCTLFKLRRDYRRMITGKEIASPSPKKISLNRETIGLIRAKRAKGRVLRENRKKNNKSEPDQPKSIKRKLDYSLGATAKRKGVTVEEVSERVGFDIVEYRKKHKIPKTGLHTATDDSLLTLGIAEPLVSGGFSLPN